MSCMNLLPAKAPAAERIITFDFTPALPPGVVLAGQVGVTGITVIAGVEDPITLAVGTPVVNLTNTMVNVPVSGGADGCYYGIDLVYATTDPDTQLTVSAVLPVKAYS